ncbi:uncharacterized protein LOC113214027 [Frankliniella occidentalis]|uniref:Uncharacterized protein LOC113214027 n=1 Tax=Frankliniella occidentalis TaxID=133901 RepID=A0A6J1T619_FRAOC|nr:uncharacterized protein LOC113214027 [Frankliniella occidentalis]
MDMSARVPVGQGVLQSVPSLSASASPSSTSQHYFGGVCTVLGADRPSDSTMDKNSLRVLEILSTKACAHAAIEIFKEFPSAKYSDQTEQETDQGGSNFFSGVLGVWRIFVVKVIDQSNILKIDLVIDGIHKLATRVVSAIRSQLEQVEPREPSAARLEAALKRNESLLQDLRVEMERLRTRAQTQLLPVGYGPELQSIYHSFDISTLNQIVCADALLEIFQGSTKTYQAVSTVISEILVCGLVASNAGRPANTEEVEYEVKVKTQVTEKLNELVVSISSAVRDKLELKCRQCQVAVLGGNDGAEK